MSSFSIPKLTHEPCARSHGRYMCLAHEEPLIALCRKLCRKLCRARRWFDKVSDKASDKGPKATLRGSSIAAFVPLVLSLVLWSGTLLGQQAAAPAPGAEVLALKARAYQLY